MTRLALFAVLIASTARAQAPVECNGNTCNVGQPGNDVVLGGLVKTTVGPLGDGGTAFLLPAVPGVPLVIQSQQPTGTSTAAAVTIQASNKHDGGTILSVMNGLVEVFAVGPGGVTAGGNGGVDGGPLSATSVSISGATPIALTNVTAPTTITSAVSAASASTSNAAFVLQPVNALDATDTVLCVARSDGACLYTFAYNGKLTVPLNDFVGNAASDVTGFRGFSSVAGSGSNAITLTTEGARIGTGPDTSISESGTGMVLTAAGGVLIPNSTTCTLNGASPSQCTATVRASAVCNCSNVGASAAIAAAGCAVGLVSTTLTVTSANAATHVVNINCDR